MARWRPREGGGRGDHGHVDEANRAVESATTDSDFCLETALARLTVEFLFCPDLGRGHFTGTYEAAPLQRFGSVNAGSGRSLRVGGSGLNGQFERDLANAGQPIAPFQRVHQQLSRLAARSPGHLVEVPAPALSQVHRGLDGAFAMVSAEGGDFVAIDVFREDVRPLHPSNVAMLYCVGPDRRDFQEDAPFLAKLSQVARGLARTCYAYNQHVQSEGALPSLQRVRVGLVSGGKFAGKVTKAEVAWAFLEGLIRGITSAGEWGDFSFEFAFDEGVFERAWSEMQALAPKRD